MNDLIIPSSGFVLPEEGFVGFERGYNQNADVLRETVDGRDLNAMWREFQASLRLWNSERDALLNFLTFNVDASNPTETVYQPSTAEDFEEASEFGEPKGIRLGRPWQMGYGFKWYDIAVRYTWMYLAEAMASQVESLHGSVLEAGNRLYFSQVMRRIFNSTNDVAEIDGANYNVYTLYNADGVVPPPYHGTTFDGTHTHFLVSGGATVDSGDLDDMEAHLYHHGYRFATGYNLILIVNRAQGLAIRKFNVADGDSYDFIANGKFDGGLVLPQNGGIVGQPQGVVRNQIGTYGPWHVMEDDYAPSGYMLGFATGGQDNLGNLIGVREHANASLRGLRLVKGPDKDYPLTDSFYQFGFGTGVRHRGAGVVMKIAASGSYTAPSIYA